MQLPGTLHDCWQVRHCDAGPRKQPFSLPWQVQKLQQACTYAHNPKLSHAWEAMSPPTGASAPLLHSPHEG